MQARQPMGVVSQVEQVQIEQPPTNWSQKHTTKLNNNQKALKIETKLDNPQQ